MHGFPNAYGPIEWVVDSGNNGETAPALAWLIMCTPVADEIRLTDMVQPASVHPAHLNRVSGTCNP